jgi:putative chitinase
MNRKAFFDACRAGVMGPTLEPGEVSGASAILDAMTGTHTSWCAYALATAWHETAHTMQPIKEYGGPRYFFRMYDPQGERPTLAKSNGNTRPGDGARYFGRGYVQLTWRANYARAGKRLGFDLENDPDLALRPDIAALIMRRGMEEAWFTGKGFSDYLPDVASRGDFIKARRIINGSDKAEMIADYAVKFQSALMAGGWA